MPRSPSDGEFTEFVHASWASLYRTAYLMLGDRAEAEDLVQTTLAKTYASWSKVRDVGAAPGHARTVLVNTAASWFRKKSWRNERPTATLPDRAHETDPTDRPAVVDALAQLPPRQREVTSSMSAPAPRRTPSTGAPARSPRRTRSRLAGSRGPRRTAGCLRQGQDHGRRCRHR